jgi:hypothetical protein
MLRFETLRRYYGLAFTAYGSGRGHRALWISAERHRRQFLDRFSYLGFFCLFPLLIRRV